MRSIRDNTLPKKVYLVLNIVNDEIIDLITHLDNIYCLSFDTDFNKNLDLTQMTKLEELYLSNDFNHYIEFYPKSLKKIKFGISFNQNIDNLPLYLEELTLGKSFNLPIRELPHNLKVLDISNCNQLPKIQFPHKLRIIK